MPRIESLEDRLVPVTINTGTLLVANVDAGNNSNPYQGIIGVDPSSGAQTQLFRLLPSDLGTSNTVWPSDVTEGSDGYLYVADVGANNAGGGIISSTVTVLKNPGGGGLAAICDDGLARHKCEILRYAAVPA